MGAPERTGLPPSGQTYTPATPNSWGPISADETLGLVYLPTGNATPDYYGAQRRPFDDRYSSSVVALDAETGRLRWSFQTLHHDVWDYDVGAQPTLVDLPTPGGGVEHALIQATKRGEIFVLDRATGRPLRQVAERPAPQRGAAPGERLAATQPYSTALPSFRGPDLREADMWGVTPLDQLYCRIRFRMARYDGHLTPPGLKRWIASPGFLGGVDWGSVSVDIDHGVMFVNSNRMANYNRLLTRAESDALGLRPLGAYSTNVSGPVPQLGVPYGASIHPFFSRLKIPCQEPPYGMISAVDLVTGKLIWTHSLGTAREVGPLGVPVLLPIPLGTLTTGGSMTTRSGVVFIGATQDRTFRALEASSGKLLWQAILPGDGFATPMTYVSPASGRQFVVIAAGGSHGIGPASSASMVAFALPKGS
jgi:quinoprotein glucose dehydrogenase